ncbi:hypothetical protein Q3G72_015634 [Acer saccharum]|nr:hypothetical protein Q3G72_015634 [Acer saccharum]
MGMEKAGWGRVEGPGVRVVMVALAQVLLEAVRRNGETRNISINDDVTYCAAGENPNDACNMPGPKVGEVYELVGNHKETDQLSGANFDLSNKGLMKPLVETVGLETNKDQSRDVETDHLNSPNVEIGEGKKKVVGPPSGTSKVSEERQVMPQNQGNWKRVERKCVAKLNQSNLGVKLGKRNQVSRSEEGITEFKRPKKGDSSQQGEHEHARQEIDDGPEVDGQERNSGI